MRTFFQGLAIGAANAIPGVSGGTLALMFGIYEKLINSLKSLASLSFWRAMLGLRFQEASKQLQLGFIGFLLLGAVVALLSLARVLEWGFVNYPSLVLGFFFGLILASVFPVLRHIRAWSPLVISMFVFGVVFGFVLVGLTPASLPNTWPFLFASGFLAASAMIVPGISGAFILVLLGNYTYILQLLNNRDIAGIFIVGVGAIVGLLSLAQVLSWLFKKYRNMTLAVLAGFMLGSLRKIWPWKTGGFESTEIPINVWPQLMVNGALNTDLLYSGGLLIFGIVLVVLLERFGQAE